MPSSELPQLTPSSESLRSTLIRKPKNGYEGKSSRLAWPTEPCHYFDTERATLPRFLKNQTCACGRSKPILKWIDGRIEDYVETRDGRLVGRMDHVFKDSPNIREAQILQVSPGHIRVKMALRDEFDAHDQKALESNFLMRLGVDMKIDFESVDVIARGTQRKV